MQRLLILIFAMALSWSVEAQYGKKKKRPRSEKTEEVVKTEQSRESESNEGVRVVRTDTPEGTRGNNEQLTKLMNRVWFGAGAQLSFSGFNGQSAFRAGLSPMAGYKITPSWSVGPRLEYQYFSQRFLSNTGDILKLNFSSFGAGAFSRLKFLDQFFIHAEYQILSTRDLNLNNWQFEGDRIIAPKTTQNFGFIGGGLYSGGFGGLGTAVYILVDVIEEVETTSLPIYFRFELNYNF